MGNILSYNRNTNELVARNSTPTRIVRYIYKFTLYDVNFSSEHMYYVSNDWIVTSTGIQELRLGYAFNDSSIKNIYKFTLNSVPFQASNVTVSSDWIVSSVSDGNSLYDVTFEYKPSGTPTNLDLTTLVLNGILVASLDETITQVYGTTQVDWWTDKDDTNSFVTTTINDTTLTVKSLSNRNVTFTYVGTGGETDNKYYTLNIDTNNAIKIAQFARLADLTVNSTNLSYETKFTWVSKQNLDGVTINEDEYNDALDDSESRDYAIIFVTNDNYIEKRLIDYKPNLGEIYINYDTTSNMTSLYQICISNVNPIGVGPSYSNYGQEFYYINPSWTVTKSTSPYDSTKIDYLFTYNGGGSYVFNGSEQILLARFYKTLNEESSNIKDTTYVLSIEQPLEEGDTIFDKTLIDKIHVNTITSNGQEEIQYAVTPLEYFKSQALLTYAKENWTGLYNGYGLRSIEIFNVNLDQNSLLAKTYLKDLGDWSFSSTNTAVDDGTLTNLKMEYTGSTGSYGYTGNSVVIFFKLLSRAVSDGNSNITDNTLVKLSLADNINSVEYITTGYFINISNAENVEYLGCDKMFNYNPKSGLLKYNGVLDHITAFPTFDLLDVNLTTDSDYHGFDTDWSITSNNITSMFGIYKDITINYKDGTSSYAFTSNVVEHFCKFYKVSSQLSASNINMDTVVRIPLKLIPGSGVSSGDAYIDLIHVGTGVEYWSRARDISNNRINAGYIEYYGDKALFNIENDPNVAVGEELGTIKKFVIENVNANADGVFHRINEEKWTVSSVGSGNTHTITAEYKNGTNDLYGSFTNPEIFRLTRTAERGIDSNITAETLIRIYRNYGNEDEEENYFVNFLLPDGSLEYIDGTSVIHYSKYDGKLSLLNNGDLGSVDSIEFFDVNVDTTSVYNTFDVDNKIVSVSHNTSLPYYDIKFTFNNTLTVPNVVSPFVRFNRLGVDIPMSDLSDSNISETSVFHFVQGTTVDAYLSLMSIADDDWEYEYYSKQNYIEYYANLGELRLRRSIIDTIFAVELVAINEVSVHFVNPDWTASSGATNVLPGGGSSGSYDLRLEYEPNNNRIVRYSDGNISIGYPKGGSVVKKIYKFVLKSVDFQATDVSVTTAAANDGWTVSSVSDGGSYYDVTFAYKPSGNDATLDLESTQSDIATLPSLSNNTLIQIWDETASDIPVTEETFYNGPYVFPTNDGNVDDYVRLCTFYYDTTLSGIETEVTQVRLYIKDADNPAETENVIDKIGQENSTIENGVNYYMKTGTIKINQSLLGEEFRNLHRLVFYGVNVNAACIYSRTFTQIAAWTVTSQQNFYNSDYVDLIITYNGATDYIVAGEVFLFQFFDTVNRTFENAGLIDSKSSGSVKETPVTWYSTRDIIDQDYDTSPTAISGYFIGNEDGGNPSSYEYYSENARIFKYYNNRGVTEILKGVSSRIAKVKSVTLLDVNFSRSQIYPAGTGLGITVDSEDAAVYQDFSIIFNSAHDVTTNSGSDKELITVYDFYDVNLVDYLMNNDTIALVYDGTTTFPIRTISAENAEYYKMDGIINYYGNNGDINFMNKSYGGLSTSDGVYKIEMENVNATTNEVIIVYGSWTVTSTRVGSLYTLRFEYGGIGDNDTFIEGENFINIALLLGYYSSIYGSSLVNKDTIVTVTFDKNKTSNDDIAKGKLVRLVSDPTEYDVTFTDRKKYPVPTNLYTRYKEYNFLFLTGDGRKNGKNTCISVFSRTVLTGITGKTQEPIFEANASKVQMVRYTVLKSKTAPYDFSCEESGYTNFDVDSKSIDLRTIGIRFGPQRDIPSNYPAISLMENTLGGGKHTMYEILDSIIVVTISKYNGSHISSQVKKLLEIYGTNFNSFNLTSEDCYMCVLFVNRKFETPKDLATLSSINQSDFTLSQRERNTIVYENSASTKLVIVIPYAQMSAYMKYHYESVRNMGNTVRLPNVMLLNAERTLNNYRKNALVYDVNVLS